jgi:hypothetical protein
LPFIGSYISGSQIRRVGPEFIYIYIYISINKKKPLHAVGLEGGGVGGETHNYIVSAKK